MTIDDKLLEKLEKLGNIKIDENKKEATKQQLTEILGFVENLNSVNLDEVELKYSGATPMREDTPRGESDIPNLVLSHAPKSENNFFIVPKIIE